MIKVQLVATLTLIFFKDITNKYTVYGLLCVWSCFWISFNVILRGGFHLLIIPDVLGLFLIIVLGLVGAELQL